MSVQEVNLKAIADAIREKDGTSDPIPASTFPARILAIPSGGVPEGVYTISAEAEPPEGGSVSGSGVVSEGMSATVTVSASAGDGYKFAGWQEDGEKVSENKDYSFLVTGSRTLTAVFADAAALPEGYTELEYITNPGTIKKNSAYFTLPQPMNGTRLDIEYKTISQGTGDIIGTPYLSGEIFGLRIWDSDLRHYYNSTYETVSSENVNWHKNKVVIDVIKKQVEFYAPNIFPKIITSANTQSWWSRAGCMLFSGYYGPYPNLSIYSLKTFDINDNIEKIFVPCISPDGVVGMYETVTGQFFASETSVSFTAGPAV